MDRPLDKNVAEKGLKDNTARKVEDDSLYLYVREAYDDKIINDKRRFWMPWHTCQEEAEDLVERAKQLQEQENNQSEKDS